MRLLRCRAGAPPRALCLAVVPNYCGAKAAETFALGHCVQAMTHRVGSALIATFTVDQNHDLACYNETASLTTARHIIVRTRVWLHESEARQRAVHQGCAALRVALFDCMTVGCLQTPATSATMLPVAFALRFRQQPAAVSCSFGTMEELLEVITWQQLGYHAKPVGILNIDGFFDMLLQFFDHSTSQVCSCSLCAIQVHHAQRSAVRDSMLFLC